MKEIEIRASRRKFICTNKDKIMYNGSCYQLMTQTYHKDWCDLSPVISEAEFKRLLKLGVLGEPYKVVRNTFGDKFTVTYYDFEFKE